MKEDENKNIIINLEGKYDLKNINTDEMVGEINTQTGIKFSYCSENEYKLPKYGFIYWDFVGLSK